VSIAASDRYRDLSRFGKVVYRIHHLRRQAREMLVTLSDTGKVQERMTRVRRD
jgi:hypothetical protein